MAQEVSSIDRLVTSGALAPTPQQRGGFLACAINAVVFGLLGLGMLIAWGTVANAPDGLGIMGGVWLLSGIGCAIGAGFLWRKGVRQGSNRTKLTPEGRTLFDKLSKQVRVPKSASWWDMEFLSALFPHTTRQFVGEEEFALLDTAAFHYNRVLGVIEAHEAHSGVARIAAGARAAADEAMVAIFNLVGQVHKAPEIAPTLRGSATAQIAALKELGDRLQEIVAAPPSLTDKLGSTSAMDAVLEQLRMDEIARRELSGDQDRHLNA